MDNRFPQLKDLALLPGSPEDAKRVRAQAEEVCRRTGAKVLYNVVHKRLHFYLTDAAFGYALPDYMVRVWSDRPTRLDVDALVCRIKDAFRSKAEKDREMDLAKQEADYREAEAQRKYVEDQRPESLALLRRKGNRCGMGRHFRPVVTVDGFKERSSGLLVPSGG